MGYGQAVQDDIAAWGLIRAAEQYTKQAHQYEQAASEGAGVALANAENERQVLLSNSFRATFDAAVQRDLGQLYVSDLKREGAAKVGTLKVALAFSGFSDTGSSMDVLTQQVYENARTVNAAIFQSQRAQKKLELEASDLRNASLAAKVAGDEKSRQIIRTGQMQSYAAQAQAISAKTQAVGKFVSMVTNIVGGASGGGM